ncbi:transposase [Pseudoroseomonas wenyumeiae]
MSDRMSARTEFVEVVTRGERRRRWSPEQKLRIVAEAMDPTVAAVDVARRWGIGTGLLYTWRRELLMAVTPAPITPRLPAIAAEEAPARMRLPSLLRPPRCLVTDGLRSRFQVVSSSVLMPG